MRIHAHTQALQSQLTKAQDMQSKRACAELLKSVQFADPEAESSNLQNHRFQALRCKPSKAERKELLEKHITLLEEIKSDMPTAPNWAEEHQTEGSAYKLMKDQCEKMLLESQTLLEKFAQERENPPTQKAVTELLEKHQANWEENLTRSFTACERTQVLATIAAAVLGAPGENTAMGSTLEELKEISADLTLIKQHYGEGNRWSHQLRVKINHLNALIGQCESGGPEDKDQWLKLAKTAAAQAKTLRLSHKIAMTGSLPSERRLAKARRTILEEIAKTLKTSFNDMSPDRIARLESIAKNIDTNCDPSSSRNPARWQSYFTEVRTELRLVGEEAVELAKVKTEHKLVKDSIQGELKALREILRKPIEEKLKPIVGPPINFHITELQRLANTTVSNRSDLESLNRQFGYFQHGAKLLKDHKIHFIPSSNEETPEALGTRQENVQTAMQNLANCYKKHAQGLGAHLKTTLLSETDASRRLALEQMKSELAPFAETEPETEADRAKACNTIVKTIESIHRDAQTLPIIPYTQTGERLHSERLKATFKDHASLEPKLKAFEEAVTDAPKFASPEKMDAWQKQMDASKLELLQVALPLSDEKLSEVHKRAKKELNNCPADYNATMLLGIVAQIDSYRTRVKEWSKDLETNFPVAEKEIATILSQLSDLEVILDQAEAFPRNVEILSQLTEGITAAEYTATKELFKQAGTVLRDAEHVSAGTLCAFLNSADTESPGISIFASRLRKTSDPAGRLKLIEAQQSLKTIAQRQELGARVLAQSPRAVKSELQETAKKLSDNHPLLEELRKEADQTLLSIQEPGESELLSKTLPVLKDWLQKTEASLNLGHKKSNELLVRATELETSPLAAHKQCCILAKDALRGPLKGDFPGQSGDLVLRVNTVLHQISKPNSNRTPGQRAWIDATVTVLKTFEQNFHTKSFVGNQEALRRYILDQVTGDSMSGDAMLDCLARLQSGLSTQVDQADTLEGLAAVLTDGTLSKLQELSEMLTALRTKLQVRLDAAHALVLTELDRIEAAVVAENLPEVDALPYRIAIESFKLQQSDRYRQQFSLESKPNATLRNETLSQAHNTLHSPSSYSKKYEAIQNILTSHLQYAAEQALQNLPAPTEAEWILKLKGIRDTPKPVDQANALEIANRMLEQIPEPSPLGDLVAFCVNTAERMPSWLEMAADATQAVLDKKNITLSDDDRESVSKYMGKRPADYLAILETLETALGASNAEETAEAPAQTSIWSATTSALWSLGEATWMPTEDEE